MGDDELIRKHESMVRNIVERLRRSLDLTCDKDDLYGWANQGLLEAHARFDSERGVRFSTFAYYRVRGAVMDGVRAQGYVSRKAYAKLRAAEAVDDTSEALGEERAARGQDSTAARGRDLDAQLARITAAYTMAAVGQDKDHTDEDPETLTLHAENKRRVRECLQQLPERERVLLEQVYFEGRRLDHAGETIGVSKSWASRLHAKALSRLRTALDSA